MARPMYRQIAEDLRDQIQSGAFPPGTRLPTEADLRQNYGVSRNTVRDAIRWLDTEGLVETRPGQGTFAVERTTPFLTTLSGHAGLGSGGDKGIVSVSEMVDYQRPADASPTWVEISQASADIAALLQIAPGAETVTRHQQRYIEGTPWSSQTSFYPMAHVTSGRAPRLVRAEDIREGAVSYLDTSGIKQAGYQDRITTRTANADEQAFFRLPHTATVFEIFRTAFDQAGTPIRVTVTVFPVDRNQLVVNVGDVPDHRRRHPATGHHSG